MVTRTKLLTAVLITVSIILFLFFLICNFWNYKYPTFVFNKQALLLIIGFILAFDIITFILCTVTKNFIVLPLIVVVLFFTFIILSACTAGVFWESRIDVFDNFSGADGNLHLRIAGVTIDDITESDIHNVEGFYYSYQSVLLSDSFEFKGHFTFSEESYNDIKNAFLTAPEFNEVRYDTPQSIEYGMTGEFVIDTTIPRYETKTSVDEWNTIIIRFNDETFSFYFDLAGMYET